MALRSDGCRCCLLSSPIAMLKKRAGLQLSAWPLQTDILRQGGVGQVSKHRVLQACRKEEAGYEKNLQNAYNLLRLQTKISGLLRKLSIFSVFVCLLADSHSVLYAGVPGPCQLWKSGGTEGQGTKSSKETWESCYGSPLVKMALSKCN